MKTVVFFRTEILFFMCFHKEKSSLTRFLKTVPYAENTAFGIQSTCERRF